LVNVLITGGTIDKQYNKLDGNLVLEHSYLKNILEQARCTIEISIRTIMLKDSLNMVDADREMIVRACMETETDKIIISHGTDTMVQTAELIDKRVKGKTVVLFGAMIPFTFGYSDALFNFGLAVASVQSRSRGVYITMNGKIFNAGNVRKNRTLGVFEEIG